MGIGPAIHSPETKFLGMEVIGSASFEHQEQIATAIRAMMVTRIPAATEMAHTSSQYSDASVSNRDFNICW